MGLNFFERIFARSEIKKTAAENKETFLEAASTGDTTQQQMDVVEAYYDASTEVLLKNVKQLNSDSTAEDVMELMMKLVIQDLTSGKPGIISKKIKEESGLDFEGKVTPDIPDDDLSRERFIAEIIPLVNKGYAGVFEPKKITQETQQPIEDQVTQESEEHSNSNQTPASPSTTIDAISGGTPKIVTAPDHDEIQIGNVPASDYFLSFADPEMAQQRIDTADTVDAITQPAMQNHDIHTTALAVQ